jgi:subfamily B ATP-binding cassette protein MsbA
MVYGAASAALAYLVRVIIDEVLPHQREVGFVATAVVIVYVAKGLGSYFSAFLMADVGQHVVMDLRNALYRHLLEQSAAYYARRTTGQLMSRLLADVGQLQQVASETVADLLRESLAIAGFAAYLLWIDARLAVVCLTGAPLIVYPLSRLGKRLRRSTRRSQEQLERLSHISNEVFSGHRIVKAFGTERREGERFAEAARRLFRANMRVTAVVSSLPPVMELLGGLGTAAVLWYGARTIADGRLTAGEFTSFVAALFLMYGPAKKLSRVTANLQQAMAAADRVFETLDTHTEIQDAPGAVPLAPLREAIVFDRVGFHYDDDPAHPILRDVSFTVRAGQVVALVGRSGAGKTTLANLIPRFYDVTAGAILIDGIDIRQATVSSLRRQIGMVTQETVLFDDSIANNIAYGVPGATPAQIEEAARSANAHEFIMATAGGYATRIGERGQRLSGGQRQRLAIARALLKDPPILILDEATSSLDSESEQLVQAALANLMRNRTSIVIAHRLSTVQRADAILVLERGRVVEVGRHDELLVRPGGVVAQL